jgi:hypothetical protein
MNIIEQGKQFVQSLHELAGRTVWDWRRCAHCGGTLTCKNGSYVRRPWFLDGRRTVRVQRHWCHESQCSYSEQSALFVRSSWHAREVHRCAIALQPWFDKLRVLWYSRKLPGQCASCPVSRTLFMMRFVVVQALAHPIEP